MTPQNLMATLAAKLAPCWQKGALGLGFMLAVVLAVSRVMVQAHSVSEVVLGLLLGSAVTLLAISKADLPRGTWRLYVPVLLAPPLPTHQLVTRLALLLSGHARPYTRLDLLRGLRPKTPVPRVQPSVSG